MTLWMGDPKIRGKRRKKRKMIRELSHFIPKFFEHDIEKYHYVRESCYPRWYIGPLHRVKIEDRRKIFELAVERMKSWKVKLALLGSPYYLALWYTPVGDYEDLILVAALGPAIGPMQENFEYPEETKEFELDPDRSIPGIKISQRLQRRLEPEWAWPPQLDITRRMKRRALGSFVTQDGITVYELKPYTTWEITVKDI